LRLKSGQQRKVTGLFLVG